IPRARGASRVAAQEAASGEGGAEEEEERDREAHVPRTIVVARGKRFPGVVARGKRFPRPVGQSPTGPHSLRGSLRSPSKSGRLELGLTVRFAHRGKPGWRRAFPRVTMHSRRTRHGRDRPHSTPPQGGPFFF